MDEIVQEYKRTRKDFELELRYFNISQEIFTDLKNKFTKLGNVTESNTIDFIKSQGRDLKFIWTKFYDRKQKKSTSETFTEKKNIKYHYVTLGTTFKISLSKETKVSKFHVNPETTIVRVKRRFSFEKTFKGFRVDMTMVLQFLFSDVKDLPSRIHHLFGLSINEFQIIPNVKFELEIEHITSPRDLESENLIDIHKSIISMMEPQEVNKQLMKDKIKQLAKKFGDNIHAETLKLLLPRVTTLDKIQYGDIFPPIGYYLTDKIDGERGLIIIQNNTLQLITHEIKEWCFANGEPTLIVGSQKLKKSGDIKNLTIIDCEVYEDKIYTFDVLWIDGESIIKQTLSERLKHLENATKLVQEFISAQPKEFTELTEENLEKTVQNIVKPNKNYKKDGIILSKNTIYFAKSNFKWKPLELVTIDFLVKKSSVKNIYYLFSGITQELMESLNMSFIQDYPIIFPDIYQLIMKESKSIFPIQFQPSNFPLAYIFEYSGKEDIDGQICELSFGGISKNRVKWSLIKVRSDRQHLLQFGNYYGNFFEVAEKNWLNYMDPFHLEELYNGPVNLYFSRQKNDRYDAQTAFISFVKSDFISKLVNKNTVVDCGIGKGQDLRRYFEAGISYLIGIDIDSAALAEVIRRKFSLIERTKIRYKTNVTLLNIDLTIPHIQIIEQLKQMNFEKTDAIVFNLSIHYLIGNEALMLNIITLCKKITRENAVVMITCLDGRKVSKLLETLNLGEKWSVVEDDLEKYAIEKRYKGKTLEKTGQKIAVRMPFTNEYYEENLVNIDHLIKMFKLQGFTLESEQSFEAFEEKYNSSVRLAKKFTENDKKWVYLFVYLLFKKGIHNN